MSNRAVNAVAFEAVRDIGGCADIDPTGNLICILDLDHDGPHGWSVARQGWVEKNAPSGRKPEGSE